MHMVASNTEQARFNMIEQQIRTWEVLDTRVLDLLHQVPREEFVPAAYRNVAYSDIAIPIAHGQEILHPKYQAHILQALNLQETDTVLEIGTGTGYLTALLAKACDRVYSVEIYPDLLTAAGRNIRKLDIENVTLEEGDGSQGWNDHAPYDAIAITGALHEIPEGLKKNLKIGGRLFAIVGESPAMEARLLTRTGENSWSEESLFETDLAYLVNAEKAQKFEF